MLGLGWDEVDQELMPREGAGVMRESHTIESAQLGKLSGGDRTQSWYWWNWATPLRPPLKWHYHIHLLGG